MKNRSLLIPLIILAILLIAYFGINSLRDVTSKPQMLVAVDTTDISGVIIKNNEGVTELKRSAEDWRVTQPVDYPADMRYVGTLLDKIASMEIENMVTTAADKDSAYGLDTTAIEVTIITASGEATQVLVGIVADSYRHTYCRKFGDDAIYRVKGNYSGQLNRKTKDWRDKKIFQISADDIDRFDYSYPRETFSVVKGDTSWALEVKGESRPVEKRVISQLTTVTGNLRATDFVDGEEAKALDFSSSDLSLTVSSTSGTSYKLSFIPQDEDANRYLVKKEGLENTIFVVYKGTVNTLMKHPDDFEPAPQPELKK